MIKSNDSIKINKKENNKRNDLLLNNNLSSGEKRIIKIHSKDCNLIIDSLNNFKLNNLAKNNSKYSRNKYKPFLNYSFSNKASGNELSKMYFETIGNETLDLDEEFNKKSNKKDVPIYINHSDYFYCPNSMKEKNLNIQILKYLTKNNLIKNGNNIIKKYQKKKNSQKMKMKKNNSFKLENGMKLNFNVNPINNKNLKNENNLIKNNNESLILNRYIKDKNELSNQKISLNQFKTKNINNYKINDSSQIYYNKEDSLQQIDNNKKINNIKIEHINNIKNNGNGIYNIENGNNIDKPKEKFYTFRTGKIIECNNCNITLNNNFLNNSSSSSYKKLNFAKNKIKSKNKNKKGKNLIPINLNKNIKYKNNRKIDFGQNNLNYKNSIKKEYEINYKVVNEQFIMSNGKVDKTTVNKKNNSFEYSIISLQSINDSKMFELAEYFIPKDEEFDKFKANDIINKRNNFKK